MRTSLNIFFIVAAFIAKGQTVNIQQLIDTATKGSGIFINAKPLIISLDKNRIFSYNEWLYEQKKVTLPDSTYMQFINNSRRSDTSHWTDKEFPASIIVDGKYPSIDSGYVITKFASLDTACRNKLLSQVNYYNKAAPMDRVVSFFSRPILDKSKSYAVIQYDNGHSWLMGGGGIILYHLEEGVWKKMAVLIRWSY